MLKILIVDDDKRIRDSFKMFFWEMGYDAYTVLDSSTALRIVDAEQPEIMIVDYDLPDMVGTKLIKQIRDRDPWIKFVVISGKINNAEINKEALMLGIIEFIPKPVSLRYIRDVVFPKIQKHQFYIEKRMRNRIVNLEIKSLQIAMNALESKDKYTEGHSKRVMKYCVEVIEFLPEDKRGQINQSALMRAGLLHDIGKISIAERVLYKPGSLSSLEYELIKQHPLESVKILKPLTEEIKDSIHAIKHHHERFDGGGYPDKLKGDEIPLMARILSIADSYDAMTSRRAYKDFLKPEAATRELIQEKGKQFDSEMVDAFVEYIRSGSLSRLRAS